MSLRENAAQVRSLLKTIMTQTFLWLEHKAFLKLSNVKSQKSRQNRDDLILDRQGKLNFSLQDTVLLYRQDSSLVLSEAKMLSFHMD